MNNVMVVHKTFSLNGICSKNYRDFCQDVSEIIMLQNLSKTPFSFKNCNASIFLNIIQKYLDESWKPKYSDDLTFSLLRGKIGYEVKLLFPDKRKQKNQPDKKPSIKMGTSTVSISFDFFFLFCAALLSYLSIRASDLWEDAHNWANQMKESHAENKFLVHKGSKLMRL